MTKKLFVAIFTLLDCLTANYAKADGVAWADSIDTQAEVSTSVSTNKDFRPLWSYSNKWGVYSQYEQGELTVHATAKLRLLHSRNASVGVGLGLVGSTDSDRRMLHEAYVDARFFMIDFLAGMKCYSPLASDDDVTSGNYLMSSTARPLPRLGVGIFDYWSVPLTRNWIQIKGGLFVGKMLDTDFDSEYAKQFSTDVVLHEKFVYGRIGGWHVKPYLGLTHSVQMGGTLPDGTDIPMDFWASFWGKGSEKFRNVENGRFRGEATNAAGAHQGLWDMGLDFDVQEVSGHLYFHRMFTDFDGHKPFGKKNKDHYLGLTLRTPIRWMKKINIEQVMTYDQNGEGTPDPIGTDSYGNFMVIFPGDVPDDEEPFQQWMSEHFLPEVVSEWEEASGKKLTSEYKYQFLRYTWGNGQYAGRKTYLNNGLYYQGCTQDGLSYGTPLFHSAETMKRYMTEGTSAQMLGFLANTRISAVNIGIVGEPTEKIRYRVRYTFSKNHGSLFDKYDGGSYSMVLYENYFYETSKIEHYLQIGGSYELRPDIRLMAEFCSDFGELYNASSIRLGARYCFTKKR